MITHIRPSSTALAAMSAAALLSALSGCAVQSSSTREAPATPVTITLDGDVSDWPAEAACVADAQYLYIRVAPSEELFTLQHSEKSLSVFFDVDADGATGLQADEPAEGVRGSDLEIRFSPKSDDAQAASARNGVAVFAIDASGTRTRIRNADLALTFAPTFAAQWYELRIARAVASPALPKRGLATAGGRVRGIAVLTDSSGGFDGSTDPFETSLTQASAFRAAATSLPDKPGNATRVMSWNVLKGKLVETPQPFARVFRAVAPDVILLQEWGEGDPVAWFTTIVPSPSGWKAVKAGDCVVLSRNDISRVGQPELSVSTTEGPRGVRFVAGVTTGPAGEIVVGSMHLKCCGGAGGSEDQRRIAEAKVIRDAMRSAQGLPAARVFGGDLNLVGTRTPLDELRAGLDADASELAVADARVLGDSASYTWVDWATDFTPGRLDYLLYSDASVEAGATFVLDTSKLSPQALERAGLRADDTSHSDHLPVILDVLGR